MTRSELLESAIETARYNLEFLKLHNKLESRDVQFTLDLLLAEQKRSEGCDVCRGIKILHGTFHGVIAIDKGTQVEVDSDGDVDFRFCPECGRDLTDGESV